MIDGFTITYKDIDPLLDRPLVDHDAIDSAWWQVIGARRIDGRIQWKNDRVPVDVAYCVTLIQGANCET